MHVAKTIGNDTKIIPGHGPASVTRADLRKTRDIWMTLNQRLEDHAKQGCLATAMHAINAIPTVLAAEPGIYDLSTISPFVAHWTNRV